MSIEGLLLMFKSAMGAADHLMEAASVLLSAVILTVGLYVYLGARAEAQPLAINCHKGK